MAARSSSRRSFMLLAFAAAAVSSINANALPQTPDDFPPLPADQEALNERDLVSAVENLDWENVRQLLPQVRNLNNALDAGLLTASAAANRNDILFYLLDDRNVDPNLRTAGGNQKTAIMHAAEGSNTPGVEKLLEAGAEPEMMDSGNWTALHYAAKNGDANMVRRLVALVDSRTPTTDGNTPLHIAAQYRHPGAIDVLCLASIPRPDPNAENILNQTPLRVGCCDVAEVLAALLERCGADPNRVDYLNRTPLHYAATAGALDATELLVKANANPMIADAMGETPRQIAKRGNHMDVAKVLRNAEKTYLSSLAAPTTTPSTTTTTQAPSIIEEVEDLEPPTVDEDEGDEIDEEEEDENAIQGNKEDITDRRPMTNDIDDEEEKARQQPSSPKKKKKDDQNLGSWLQYFAPFFLG